MPLIYTHTIYVAVADLIIIEFQAISHNNNFTIYHSEYLNMLRRIEYVCVLLYEQQDTFIRLCIMHTCTQHSSEILTGTEIHVYIFFLSYV